MNKDKYMEQLLSRFMKAETTEDEEAELAEYFREASDIPTDWLPYKEYFTLLDADSDTFGDERNDSSTRYFDNDELDSFLEENVENKEKWSINRRWIYAAACLITLITLAVVWRFAANTSFNKKVVVAESTKPVVKPKTIKEVSFTTIKDSSLQIAEKKLPGQTKVRKKSLYKRKRQDIEDEVPVPEPMTATEVKRYVATSHTAMKERKSQQTVHVRYDESVAEIRAKGEALEKRIRDNNKFRMYL